MPQLPSAIGMTVFMAQLVIALFILRFIASKLSSTSFGKALGSLVG